MMIVRRNCEEDAVVAFLPYMDLLPLLNPMASGAAVEILLPLSACSYLCELQS